ncbi:HD-GYP domain-containing protein [Arenimonas fontis]|uniref:HD-GYP domain-containing protein n=1 Tax=Arenimonas fontis TaxID=2608255 RepID=A0A5B2ZF02_9GAMM|nr:HD-GYP domain-containing protein [Arenimonas fontis]KAA2285794.1 HD-GYP domain-containing protein [Arenimonas fontis]
MALEEKRILVGLLEVGMYVSRLDRDWLGTPFPFQGFHVRSDDDIELLSKYCTWVYIDVEKGRDAGAADQPVKGRGRAQVFPPRGPAYRDLVPLEQELPQARDAHARAHSLARRIAEDVRRGRRLSAAAVQEAMEPLVESLVRNGDALFWMLARLRRDDYAYGHAVNCGALAAAFGRHLALPRETLVELATGGFLLDVGKASLPDELLAGAGELPPDAMERIRGHVAEGMRVVEEAGIRGGWVKDMVGSHHERHDGSGYPQGLSGDAIPLGGRMAAVVDSFDAMSSDRPYRRALARHGALQQIYRGSGTLYQAEVVEQFLQCMGVYPTGSLVELNTGEVAIVMAQNRARRLRPRVMLLLDPDKRPYPRFRDVDLMSQPEGGDGTAVEIVNALDNGAYGLDPAELFLE